MPTGNEAGRVSATRSITDVQAVEDIRRQARPRRDAAGDVICREGARTDSVLVLQRGPGTWRDMHRWPRLSAAGAEAAEVQPSRLRPLARPCPA